MTFNTVWTPQTMFIVIVIAVTLPIAVADFALLRKPRELARYVPIIYRASLLEIGFEYVCEKDELM